MGELSEIPGATAALRELIDAYHQYGSLVEFAHSLEWQKADAILAASAEQAEMQICAECDRQFKTGASAFENVAAPTPAAAQDVRVCAISDIECSRGCGVGECKREREARYPVEQPAAAQDDSVTREQLAEWGRLAGFSPGQWSEKLYTAFGDFAIFARQARAAAQDWADGRLTIHPDFQDDYALFESVWAMQMPTNEMKSLCFYYFRRGAEKARAAASPVSGAARDVLAEAAEICAAAKLMPNETTLAPIHRVAELLVRIERAHRDAAKGGSDADA